MENRKEQARYSCAYPNPSMLRHDWEKPATSQKFLCPTLDKPKRHNQEKTKHIFPGKINLRELNTAC